MKREFLLAAVLVLAALTPGCIAYGKGTTFGYVTTVESAVFWDKVWVRASLQSSQTDDYCIEKSQTQLIQGLQAASANNQRLEIYYNRHLFILTGCSTHDVITAFRTLDQTGG